jgi:DNA-binding transcriptional MocR family regulator
MAIAVDLAPESALPLHVQIADSLRSQFERGDFHAGDHLPTTRDLAHELGVSRSTVVRAYEQLTREGWIQGRVGQGTLVSDRTSTTKNRPNWDLLLTERVRRQSPEYADVLRMLSQDDLLSFAGGLPSPEFYPEESFQQITSEVLRQQGPKLLQWCPADGYPPLRSWIAERIGCAPEGVLVLAGSTQGLHLVAQAFIDPGDTVLVEAPTYSGALRAFRTAGARLVSIPCGDEGIDLDCLEATLDRVRAKFLYVVPTYHNPTGSLLSADNRRRLLGICAEHGLPVVEDDAYAALRFDGPHVATLQSLDDHGLAIYVSTFSKAVFPGLRVGWLAAPVELVQRLGALRNVIDLFTNSLAQAALYEFCKRGLLDAHLQHVRPIYAERRDAMAAALRRYCPSLQFTVPHGGLFIWAKLPPGVDSRRLLEAATELGLGFMIGPLFYVEAGGSDHIRLCYACHSPDAIATGIRKLGLALKQVRPNSESWQESARESLVV